MEEGRTGYLQITLLPVGIRAALVRALELELGSALERGRELGWSS
jgi:hypothetical protein